MHCVTHALIFAIIIGEPQLVECRTSYDCTTNGTLMSAEECCVHNTDGLAYTIAGKQECHVCIGEL